MVWRDGRWISVGFLEEIFVLSPRKPDNKAADGQRGECLGQCKPGPA